MQLGLEDSVKIRWDDSSSVKIGRYRCTSPYEPLLDMNCNMTVATSCYMQWWNFHFMHHARKRGDCHDITGHKRAGRSVDDKRKASQQVSRTLEFTLLDIGPTGKGQ